MLMKQASKKGMHAYVDYCVHSQNDGKQQEWKETAVSRHWFVQLQHSQQEFVIYDLSECLV